MKAAVYLGPKNIRVKDAPEPKPKRDEALVRFKTGSICGTDLHFYRGEWTDLAVGKIIGHDACGQIEETGERIAIIPKVFRGSCRYCTHGRPSLCEHSEGFMGFDRYGPFSELIAAPKRNLPPIPPNVSFTQFERAIETSADPSKRPMKVLLMSTLNNFFKNCKQCSN